MSRGLRIVRVVLRRSAFTVTSRRPALLAGGLALIILWQVGFYGHAVDLRGDYAQMAAEGLKEQRPFVYFLYYLGLYPVTAIGPRPEMSHEAAEALLARGGSSLVMESPRPQLSPLRFGEHARILLYLPQAIWNGSPESPTVRPTNGAVLVGALMLLFAALWWAGRPMLGLLLVAFLGSNPFELYEVYAHENVFGWPIAAAIAAMGLSLPLLARRPPRLAVAAGLVVAAGLALGTARHIRSESIPVGAGVLVVCFCASFYRAKPRVVLALAFVASWLMASTAWSEYFRAKIANTNAIVERVGGCPHPYARDPRITHSVWFPIWAGLGDFDTKHGYAWDDLKAHAYVRDVLKRDYGIDFPPWSGGPVFDRTFIDAKRRYLMLPYEMPHYFEIIEDKVLHDITHDPFWYAGILGKRLWAIVTDATPVSIAVGARRLASIPVGGLVLLPALCLAWLARDRMLLLLLVFTVPLELPALMIYAKHGMTYYGIHHVVAVAVTLWLAGRVGLWTLARRRRSASTASV